MEIACHAICELLSGPRHLNAHSELAWACLVDVLALASWTPGAGAQRRPLLSITGQVGVSHIELSNRTGRTRDTTQRSARLSTCRSRAAAQDLLD